MITMFVFFFLIIILIYRFYFRYPLDFYYFMCFGVAYYIFSPYLLYLTGALVSYPGILSWREYFFSITEKYEYVCYIFFSLTVFVFFIKKITACVPIPIIKFPIVSRFSLLFSACLIMILCFYLWYSAFESSLLFSGYTVEYSTQIMGNMATANLLLNFLALYAKLVNKSKVKNFYIFIMVVNSIFLLSMGGRMYVVTIIIPWLMLYVNNVHDLKSFLKKFKVSILLIALVFLFCLIGIFRLGIRDLSFIIYIFFAEPIFTSYSTVTYLLFNPEIPLLNDGALFVNSFVGIIPSFLIDNKETLYLLPEHLGFYYESPLGATSVVIYLFTSFGILGSYFFIALLTSFYTVLSRLSVNCDFFKAFYLCALSVVPFIFFRETFYISTRVIVFPIFILPLFILIFDRCLIILSRK
ncbi:O-antigen polymerase [Pectobacterium brasiliense]|uniref:O-antigen polymerase n=1 Tax=Pectobacterium brasiliense TaxID=180957 RepID=UPI002A80FFB2|nr:O-antigen polymerase [Pectobacterium brasiliense]MDY4368061.1 O-antigen polymerase [Pectobacterium brasiliense]MDY7057593.1 O-antigen polymerase [Pectobacterium brasiliense]